MTTLKIWRGDAQGGRLVAYSFAIEPGMVVLDAVLLVQQEQAPDLACRWNCKAGKCGSCSAEINGKPRLMCMTRLDPLLAESDTITVQPMGAFPRIKDLVTDVSWNDTVKQRIPPFQPAPRGPDGEWRLFQYEVDRIQEFRKCIECFLCQDVCHVLRNHQAWQFAGPRFLIHAAYLEMHPMDTAERTEQIQEAYAVNLCNVTKCCTEVCPEAIRITDNGIIPLKERVADRYYDPVLWLWRKIRGA